MKNRFNFIEKATGKTFSAQKVMQTDDSMAYAITFMVDGLLKIELYSFKETELKLKYKSWELADDSNREFDEDFYQNIGHDDYRG